MSKRISAGNVKLKRAYEPVADDDGTRALVDRLWPRGVKKQDAAIDHWSKELSPSTELREWFGHDPARWPEFRLRFAEELRQHAQQLEELRTLARRRPIVPAGKKVTTCPEMIGSWLGEHAPGLVRVGMETRPAGRLAVE